MRRDPETTMRERVQGTREALRDELDEARVQRIWRGIERRRAHPPRRARVAALAFGAAACVVLAFALTRTPGSGPGLPPDPGQGALLLADGSPVPRALAADHRFDDGSRVHARDAALELLVNDGSTVGFALRRGRARFSVQPGGRRAWRVEAGNTSVEVVGTVFEVAREEGAVEVHVTRGVVLVRGPWVPDGVQRLEAGDRLRVTAPAPATPLAETHAQAEPPPAFAVRETEVETPRARATWRDAAGARRFEDAWEALGEDGHGHAVDRARDVDELLTLADVARYSGHAEAAVAPLTRILDDHPADARAPLAAYTRARVEVGLGRDDDALESIERALAMPLPGALREPAEALHVRALGRAGDAAGAADAARAFLARHPESPRRALVERWLRP